MSALTFCNYLCLPQCLTCCVNEHLLKFVSDKNFGDDDDDADDDVVTNAGRQLRTTWPMLPVFYLITQRKASSSLFVTTSIVPVT